MILSHSGYIILAVLMLSGTLLIWSSSLTITKKIAEQEEAKKPAEIELTLIAPSACNACTDGQGIIEMIKKQDVRILDSKTLQADSEEGSALIKTYEINRLPTILVKGQYNKERVREMFTTFGGQEKDKTLIIQITQPVYFDLTSNQAVGLVDITYLTDSSCRDCYDPKINKPILENGYGVKIQSEKTIDARSAEGRSLIATYAIKEAPTFLLSKEVNAYTVLANTWPQVGTVEQEGIFVFRRNAALGTVVYKNLETGEVVRPTPTKG